MSFRSSAYYQYSSIEKTSFRERVRYFESHIDEINGLPFDEYVEVKSDYVFALFELGKYHKFLRYVDGMIETVIIENIFTVDGRNVYEDLLFNKAACHYNLKQYDGAIYICKELIKINPTHKLAQKLFRKSLKEKGINWYEINKAIAVVFLLSAISVVMVELLVVDPFYEMYSHHVKFFRKLLLTASVGLLLFNECWVRYQCYRHVRKHSPREKKH
ncbi:MAG: tetratricopeptide repeat protein [Saprospiraceae bacterium]|nr:tetratricopeptide repeat protein [Saprospiraceae bacterium]